MLFTFSNDIDGTFQLSDFNCPDQNVKMNSENFYRIVWVIEDSVKLNVDSEEVEIQKNNLLFFTPHNIVEILSDTHRLISLSFNQEFYCISNHDHEVSCYGQLFYGTSAIVIAKLNEKDIISFKRLMEVFYEEFEYKDHIQGQMLQILLKRLLIKSSRKIREVDGNISMPQGKVDIVRKFNVLVEQNFKEKHKVKDYADMLFKSPKTLSNLFKEYNNKSPLQVINNRIILEAKRQLLNTNKTIDELAFELGYNDVAHFSKFFKNHVGDSPSSFRK